MSLREVEAGAWDGLLDRLGLDARILVGTFTQLGRPDPEPVEDTLNIERARAARNVGE